MKNKVTGTYDSEVTYIPGTLLDDKGLKKRKKHSCRDKVKFRKEKHARIKALLYGLKYYQCDYCHKWHLTRDQRSTKGKA